MSTEFPSTFCPPRFQHLEFFHIQAIFQGMILDSGKALVIVYPHDRFYLFLLKLQPICFYRPCLYIDSADFMLSPVTVGLCRISAERTALAGVLRVCRKDF